MLVDADEIRARISTTRLAVLMLTHVNYRSGAHARHGGASTRAAHAAGALMVWDLAHSAGALPVDLKGDGGEAPTSRSAAATST